MSRRPSRARRSNTSTCAAPPSSASISPSSGHGDRRRAPGWTADRSPADRVAGVVERVSPEPRRVVVIGTGLIGTSVALALRERDIDVLLADRDAASVRLAVELGAGSALPAASPRGGEPADLAVLAVPPGA